MAKANKCDWCGVFYMKNNEKRRVPGFLDPVILSQIRIENKNNIEIYRLDLCDNCMARLLTILGIEGEEK